MNFVKISKIKYIYAFVLLISQTSSIIKIISIKKTQTKCFIQLKRKNWGMIQYFIDFFEIQYLK